MRKFVGLIVIISIGFFSCCTRDAKSPAQNIQSNIELSIEPGEQWQWERKMFLITLNVTPQFAAWIEDNNGNYISTITVTNWITKDLRRNTPRRPETLPIWTHRIQNNLTPDQIDAVSTATPKDLVTTPINDGLLNKGQEYNVYLEINCSFDFNDFWTESNSGVNGQPSVIYHAKFIAGNSGRINLVPIGHGSVDGSNGNITFDLQNLTTALKIAKNVQLTIK